MGIRTSRKASIFLSINLLCYVLATNAIDGSNGPPATSPGQQPGTCPINTPNLGVCATLLGGLVGVVVGNPPTSPCCTLLAGLVDSEAAVCLCTAIRANDLGININAQVALTLLLNVCGRSPPPGFICA